jgi:hypothetical protein
MDKSTVASRQRRWSTIKLVIELVFVVGLLGIAGLLIQNGAEQPDEQGMIAVVFGVLVLFAAVRTSATKRKN